jgi:hypothetical protein
MRNKTCEAFIHVILMVALEESRTRIIGDEVDLGRRETRHSNCVLHQSGHGFVADFRDLNGMPVHVNRMFIAL